MPDAQGTVTNAKEDTRYLHVPGSSAFVTAAVRLTTNFTSSLNADDGSGLQLLTNTPAVGHTMRYGSGDPFDALDIEMTVNGVGVWTVVWEYWNGAGWVALSGVTDGTGGYQGGTGVKRVSFTRPSDWATTTIATLTRYYIQSRLSAYTSAATKPGADYAKTIIGPTDASQYETDLVPAGSGGYELNSARSAFDTTWEIYVRVIFTAAEASKVLVAHNDAAVTQVTYSLQTNGSGNLVAWLGTPGTVVWTGPVVPAGDVSIGWSCRENPDSVGSGDALISTFVVYIHSTGEWTIEQETHPAPTTAGTYTLSVGGFWDGASLISAPTNPLTECRISSSYHSSVEFAEDWINARAPHTSSLVELVEPLGAGAPTWIEGEWAGQANVGFAAAHANALRGRMLSPIINEVYLDAREYTDTPDPTQWIMPAPGSPTYSMDVTKLRWLCVDGWRYARVKVQVEADGDMDAVGTIGVRCYAMSRVHIGLGVKLDNQPIPPLEFEFVEATIIAATSGVWLDLGVLRLPTLNAQIEGWTKTVTLGLAYSIDEADDWLKIHAWQVLPIVGEP